MPLCIQLRSFHSPTHMQLGQISLISLQCNCSRYLVDQARQAPSTSQSTKSIDHLVLANSFNIWKDSCWKRFVQTIAQLNKLFRSRSIILIAAKFSLLINLYSLATVLAVVLFTCANIIIIRYVFEWRRRWSDTLERTAVVVQVLISIIISVMPEPH